MLAQTIYFGYRIGEVSCPTKYFEEASSINFRRSCTYGIGVLQTSVQFRLQKWGRKQYAIFDKNGRGLSSPNPPYYADESPNCDQAS
jgi:hypothetical protein